MKYKCAFSGSGGQGSALMAKLLCQGAIMQNLKVVMTQTYGIEQRGGDSTGYVIVSDQPIGNPIVESDADVSVALSSSMYENCLEGTAKGGVVFVNTSFIDTLKEKGGIRQVGIKASDIAVQLGSVRCANIVMLGAFLAETGVLKPETVTAVLEKTIGAKKPALLEMNIKALHEGYKAMGKE